VASLLTTPSTSDAARGIDFVLNAVVVGIAPVVIIRSLILRRVVDVQTVLGAICVYVLIGMLFAFVYGAISAFSSHQFFAQTSKTTTSDLLYFSFITLCTVGYGDLTAATNVGRSGAVLEALTGQLYLVTIISVLVSRLAAGMIRQAPETPVSSGSTEPPR
jgi:hypothetical protein